jgi:hypothetical protein
LHCDNISAEDPTSIDKLVRFYAKKSDLEMNGGLSVSLDRMISELKSGIDAEWDFGLEDMTLGGALTLRCELEMIASHCNLEYINFNFVTNQNAKKTEDLLLDVLRSSEFSFNISTIDNLNSIYPKLLMSFLNDFSYFSSSRLTVLHSYTGKKPCLLWNESVSLHPQMQDSFKNSEFAVIHLKNSGTFETSRANMSLWMQLISEVSRAIPIPILLIGDDDYPNELLAIDNVFHLKSLNVSLMSQLAITSRAKFFIGSASGVAASAIYSDTPYLIFKSPGHHQEAMNREIGSSNKFPWAGLNQLILRQEPTISSIQAFIKEIDS